MGNRMFQYAFGSVLAKEKQCPLFHDGLENFDIQPNTGNLSNHVIETKSYGYHYADVNELKATDKDILINSFLQKAEYFLPYREELKKTFNIKNNPINSDELVLHIRETDYTLINSFLGYDYYKKLILDSGFSNIIIVTDNSTCETVQKLISEGCILNSEGNVNKFSHVSDDRGMHDFNTLLQSENIAISQSSFSWWAAFLGDHKKIIFPFTTSKSMWPKAPAKDDIDLYFDLGSSQKFIV